jgi:hypothetical protein
LGETKTRIFLKGGLDSQLADLPVRQTCTFAGPWFGQNGALEGVDYALVDRRGGIAERKLVRGDNPALMTMEMPGAGLRTSWLHTTRCSAEDGVTNRVQAALGMGSRDC